MIRFENIIEIDRPIEDVFAFVAHFENLPKWNYYVMSVRQISAGLPSIGTTYHQVRREDQQDFAISEFQVPRKLTVRTTPGSSPIFKRAFAFEPTNSGTRLVDSWELETGRNPLIERLGAGKVKAAVAENLTLLKQLLESGEAHLQDGRISRL